MFKLFLNTGIECGDTPLVINICLLRQKWQSLIIQHKCKMDVEGASLSVWGEGHLKLMVPCLLIFLIRTMQLRLLYLSLMYYDQQL